MSAEQYLLLQAICRQDFASFAKKAFSIIEPGTPLEWTWHLDCIAAHLQAQYEGDSELRRLIITIPPRCLKSVLVAQLYPAWILGREAHHQIIGAAYAHSLAERNVMKTRHILKHDFYLDTFPQTILAQDQKDYFTTTQNGQYKGTGIGGTVTGFGCFVGDTEVITDTGIIKISDIKLGINCSKALSYNHKSNTLEWRAIEATRCILSDDIYEIITETGTKINCTGNHPIYTQRGYVRADHLCAGDTIIQASLAHNSKVCWVQTDIRKESGGVCKKNAQRSDGNILRSSMHVHDTQHSGKKNKESMSCLWGYNKESAKQLLFFGLFRGIYKHVSRYYMCMLQKSIQAIIPLNTNMLKEMRSANSLTKDARKKQSKIQGWFGIQHGLQADSSFNNSKRQRFMRCMWEDERDAGNGASISKNENEFSGTSYRRECHKQHTTESGNTLQQLPYYASQEDTIVMVRKIRSGSLPVYDLQIAENHNFFANSILVHNCKTLVIDDPISPKESGSDTIRLTAINEIRSTLFSRFNKFSEGRMTLIMQRLHEQDPAGDLLKDGGYYLLKLPAENKGSTITYTMGRKTWTMESGQLLTPRLTRKDLDELMLNLTEYNYVGQYLQDPVPLGGGEFKEEWLQVYHQGAIKPGEMNVVILMDQAGGEEMNRKKKKLSDWTVIAVIGLASDNNYYLLDMIRDRLNPTERVDTLFMVHKKWNGLCGKPPKVGVEQIGLMTDTHYIKEKQKQEAYHFSVIPLGGQQIKEERIKAALVPVMQQHRFYIPATLPYIDTQGRKFDLVEEMKGEMRSFPKARWDDILDAISRVSSVELGLTFPRPKATMAQRYLSHSRQEAPDNWENW